MSFINAIIGVAIKNINGYLTSRKAKDYDYKILIQDAISGCLAFGLAYGLQAGFNIEMPEDVIVQAPIYIFLTDVISRWFNAIKAKMSKTKTNCVEFGFIKKAKK